MRQRGRQADPTDLRVSARDLAKLISIGAVQAGAIIATVLILRQIVDQLVNGVRPSDALAWTYAFCAVGAILAVTRGVEYLLSERVGYRMVADLRMVLFRHLVDLPARAVNRSSQGAVLLRLTGDLSTYRTWISRGLARGIVSGFILVGGLGVLVVIDWVIALAVVTVLSFAAAASALWGYQVRRTTRAIRWRRSLLTSNIAEQIRSLATVQAFGRESGETSRLGAQNDDLLGALGRSVMARSVLRAVSSAAGTLAVGVVLLVGVLELERRRVSIGGVVAAMTAARFLSGPVRTLGRSHEYWQAAQVSKRKMQDFLAREKRSAADSDKPSLRVGRGHIVVRDISVAGALDHVDLDVQPQQLTAIVGPVGAGKSTLLSLVGGFLEADAGQVVIDDQNVAEHNIRSRTRNIGIVSPELPLMRGTIRRNLTYRYGNASDELLEQVVMSCRIDEVLESIGGGLDSWVVEGGANLSAGQRQQIALARAILGNPKLLLLDEPTANLDAATKEVFRRVIARYQGTVVLATHDVAELWLADQVCHMNAGRIVRVSSGDQYRSELTEQRRISAGRVPW